MKRILLSVFCCLAFPVVASHIVGGEFEIIHISGNDYRVNLIVYFDKVNGDPGALDAAVNARIFRMRDNAAMLNVSMPLVSEEQVSYTQPECSSGEIVTSKLTYSTVIKMSDEAFSDPLGYYMSWERCCRNYSITNIVSQNPQLSGQYAGQTFYLEFPPVVKNGEPFINSTPRLFPPLNDYACPRRPYYVDFAGVDDDGDSLVYSLVTPLNTKSADALPLGGPRPRPYPEVAWRGDFSLTNILNGEPDLKISEDGFLTVTPTQQGLFVFAVRCEEFRDGEKIGEVRRDFQMLVLDKCPQAEPPQITGKKLDDPDFTYDEHMTVTFSNTVADDARCVQVRISDPDASKADDFFTENVKIKAVPLNFKKNMSGILPEITSAVLSNGSTATFEICFDRCPPVEGPFQVGIVAMDDACSLPLMDTLKILVNIEPPPNEKPQFTTPDVIHVAREGDQLSWPIEALDADGDILTPFVLTDGFSFENVGMSMSPAEQGPGFYRTSLVWDSRCDYYDFTHKTNFEIKVLVGDLDECNLSTYDTMVFKLTVILPGNADPQISTDLSADEVSNGVVRKVYDKLEFNVFGNDADNDLVILRGQGVDFDFATYGIMFPAPGQGTAGSASAHFSWELDCDNINLNQKSEFDLEFIVLDNQNKCRFYKADTLHVHVSVEPPDNMGPDLTVTNTNPQLAFEDNVMHVLAGQQIALALVATDPDATPHADRVLIDLAEATGTAEPTGYVFAAAEGDGTAATTFAWNTDCSLFRNGVYENEYTFRFYSGDNRCYNTKTDTVTVNFVLRDVTRNLADFIPPNVVTANGDPQNEFFAMVREDPVTKSLESILPVDNCQGVFVSIVIYNRWGQEVFESHTRDFRWYPADEAAGIYFYTLKYTDKEYKGSITVKN